MTWYYAFNILESQLSIRYFWISVLISVFILLAFNKNEEGTSTLLLIIQITIVR